MAESPPLRDGATFSVPGASGSIYFIKNVGGVYSCSCPSWRHQRRDPSYRSCSHLIRYRGAQDEALRINPGGWNNLTKVLERQLVRFRPVPTSTASGHARQQAASGTTARLSTVRCGFCLNYGHNARTCAARTPGGQAIQHPAVAVVMPKYKAVPAPPVHNAWTVLMDDNSPLNDDDDPPAERK
jgi:hypothetical protein